MVRSAMLAVALVTFSAACCKADLVFSESFTYSDGAPPSPWTLTNGTGGQAISSNTLQITASGAGAGNGDYARSFSAPVSTGTLFAGFDLRITSAPTNSADNYFAHFVGTSNLFVNRLFLNLNSGNTNIALADTVAAATQTLTTPLALNTTYRVVQGYDFATGTSSVWLNPITNFDAASLVDATGTDPASITGFGFRINDGTDGNKTIDNLVVATTFSEASGITAVPEPSTFGMVGIVGCLSLMLTKFRSLKRACNR